MRFVAFMTTFSEWLSERLEMRGLSINQFAQMVGITPEGAGYWLKGRNKPLRKWHSAIARALEISEAEFARAWTEFKTDDEQVTVLKPGLIAELYSPGGNRIRLTQRLLNVLTAAAEPGEELLTADKAR